jgi:hypothetical protein
MRAPPVAVKQMKGHFLRNCGFYSAHKALADYGAHRAAHEVKFKTSRHHFQAVHRAAHDDECIRLPRIVHGHLQALGVFFAVFEFECIHGHHFLANFIAAFRVQKTIQPRAGRDAVMMATFGADHEVLLQVGFEEHRLATGAFGP